MRFTKMQGLGNDYIYVNCFKEPIPHDPAGLSRAISDRHFGVGSDGLILICPSDKADARMRMFNSDGSEAEMCGNGIRCLAKYLYDHGLVRKQTVTVETGRGVLTLEKGSRFDCRPAGRLGQVSVRGGEVILRGGRRFVDIRDDQAFVQIEKPPHQLCPLALQTTIPAEAAQGQTFMINVAQRNSQQATVGGACVVYLVK